MIPEQSGPGTPARRHRPALREVYEAADDLMAALQKRGHVARGHWNVVLMVTSDLQRTHWRIDVRTPEMVDPMSAVPRWAPLPVVNLSRPLNRREVLEKLRAAAETVRALPPAYSSMPTFDLEREH